MNYTFRILTVEYTQAGINKWGLTPPWTHKMDMLLLGHEVEYDALSGPGPTDMSLLPNGYMDKDNDKKSRGWSLEGLFGNEFKDLIICSITDL